MRATEAMKKRRCTGDQLEGEDRRVKKEYMVGSRKKGENKRKKVGGTLIRIDNKEKKEIGDLIPILEANRHLQLGNSHIASIVRYVAYRATCLVRFMRYSWFGIHRKPNCSIVVSHDDYSLMSKLPEERTSVVTILHDPIKRVFSMYEFAVQVAARSLVDSNLTPALQTSRGVMLKSSRMVSTLDVWPWKYLVPWIREDLFARREARRLGKLKRSVLSGAYNTEDVVMPLHEFISHRIAREIIHNGATFQVAGLTNSSYLDDAHEARHCVSDHPSLGHLVLEVAKGRLDRMLYVGLTEDHKKSTHMFASIVGAQVLSRSKCTSGSQPKLTDETNAESSVQVVPAKAVEGTNHTTSSIVDEASTTTRSLKGNMTTEKVMRKYDDCVKNLHNVQKAQRSITFERISPVNFTKEARGHVTDSVLKEIKILNSLDMELYRHAQSIFLQQKILMDDPGKQDQLLTEQVPEEQVAARNSLSLSVTLVPVVSVSVIVMLIRNFCCIKLFSVARLKKSG